MIHRLLAGLLLWTAAAQTLDTYIEERRKEWKVPGLAVAVVKDGRLSHLGVYGFRDVEAQKPVTPETLFGIGSLTKSFTALLLASLVEEGKIDWDRPVREFAADFTLKDAVVSKQATLRDLLSHRVGVARHDEWWTGTKLTREELYAKLRTLEMNRPFRSKWEYNNLMFMAAGVAAERVTGQTWEDLVRARLFAPLGWKRATTSVTEFAPDGDWAVTYEEKQRKLVRMEARVADNIGPAGSINASIEEMAEYLMAHLDSGVVRGRRVFPAGWLEAMRTPSMEKHPAEIPGEGKIEESYGLGLYITTHRGHRMVWHTGTIGGYHALMAYLPEERIGYVSLQNRVARALPQSLSRYIFDTMLGVTPADWNARYQEAYKKPAEVKAAPAAAKKPAAKRVRPRKPARAR